MRIWPSRHPKKQDIRQRMLTRDHVEKGLQGKTISRAKSTGNILYLDFTDGTSLSITAATGRGDAKLLFYDGKQQWFND